MASEGTHESPTQRGNALYASEDYKAAVQAFQEALKAKPSANTHEAIARCYIKMEQYMEAAESALKAITLDAGMAKAYLRRGTALFHLDEFESALEAFQKGKELRPTLAAFDDWIRKCNAEISGEVEVVEPPKPSGPKITSVQAQPSPSAAEAAAKAPASSSAEASTSGAKQQDMSAPIAPVAGVPVANKIRHQWYQLGDKVVVDVYAKALPTERFEADFSETRLRLAVLRDAAARAEEAADGEGQGGDQGEKEEGPEWELDVELFGPVDVSACRFEILRTKVEVTLRKAEAGKAWPTLEKSDKPALKAPAPAAAAPVTPAEAAPLTSEGGAGGAVGGPPRTYPTSHAKGPKDWSALEREVKEMESKGELDEGDPLNSFFQKIFSQGDEDTRRAMMKSFVESNGTVLSTNWTEVGTKKVECTPPDGMEVRKWNDK